MIVSDGAGNLTLTGAMAREISDVRGSCCTVVHVVHQRRSFAIQQAMVVADVLHSGGGTACAQV